jgi:deazaflavin-dependent oxidoreductase (nitroreductase family)
MPLPRSIARLNRAFTNRLVRPLAGHLPGLGIVIHEGRRSGKTYRTPVNVFRRAGGYSFALTYGRSEWVRNVLHAGTAQLFTRGEHHVLGNPTIIEDPDHRDMPRPVGAILRLLRVSETLRVDEIERS